MPHHPGTEGYESQSEALVAQYEAISFDERHRVVRHLLPTAPCRVLDVGAGTGADAAWFAARGDSVVAVEPTAGLRERGKALHPSQAIEWLDDGLPDLAVLRRTTPRRFDLVMLTAVWMHLDAGERATAFPHLASLVAPGGRLVFALRHGPVPVGRRMFEVGADETVQLAQAHGLRLLLNEHTASVQAANLAAGVTWTRLVFEG